MALNDVVAVFDKIAKLLHSGSANISNILAWLGVVLIIIVVSYYIVYGITKAVKVFLNMKTKYLGIFALLLGAMFIVLAVILP